MISATPLTTPYLTTTHIFQDEVVDSSDDDQAEKLPRDSRKMLEFGTNVDLSDASTWHRQLQEITKLPKFLRVSCFAAIMYIYGLKIKLCVYKCA